MESIKKSCTVLSRPSLLSTIVAAPVVIATKVVTVGVGLLFITNRRCEVLVTDLF